MYTETKKSAKYAGYNTTIEPDEDVDEDEYEEEDEVRGGGGRNAAGRGPVDVQQYFNELAQKDADVNPFEERRTKTIADRERGTYNERRSKLQLSPGVRYFQIYLFFSLSLSVITYF